ncbi:MAG: transcriptional regulator NrdR [Chloroflexi bacterium]|nr:transcriptional regulator NrdR [Chloroflexota bacterium]MBU1751680.1 transcriptional regulator NrdR [Chloroflexota bacterium]
MKCPYCQSPDSHVVDSRGVGEAIRRRRECDDCQQRFTTYERVDQVSLRIVKRDGRRERFDPDKIRAGIRYACHKRPIAEDTIDDLVRQIESEVLQLGEAEVESPIIGELVMRRLKPLDEIAYVRFAALYRRFQDAEELAQEIVEFKEWQQRQRELKDQLPLNL